MVKICIAKSTFDALRQTREARELVAAYNGMIFTDETKLPVPTVSRFNEAFADDNNGVQFKVIDRSVVIEENGAKKSKKPWNADRLVYICNDVVGTLVYGRLAEQTNPVANVDYQTIDTYKLISKYSEVNPLREITSSQAFVCPIIEDVDQIYVLDISEAQEVDEDAEKADTTDVKVTVWGTAYKKAEFITAMKALGVSIAANASDATVIKKVNELSNEDEAALKAAVESYKA